MGTYRHVLLLPAAAMIGAGVLGTGQFVFERLLRQQSSLAVVIEFAGGLIFLALVMEAGTPMIRISGLNQRIGGATILEDVDVTVPATAGLPHRSAPTVQASRPCCI